MAIVGRNAFYVPECQEIIADYEEHFLRGREIGKTEQQISESLGDPVDIAHEYLENAGQRGQNTTIVQTEQPSKTAQD